MEHEAEATATKIKRMGKALATLFGNGNRRAEELLVNPTLGVPTARQTKLLGEAVDIVDWMMVIEVANITLKNHGIDPPEVMQGI